MSTKEVISMSNNLPDSITIKWHISDVQSVADVTDDEARQVLQMAQHYHDANYGISWYGISWETLEIYADIILKEKKVLA